MWAALALCLLRSLKGYTWAPALANLTKHQFVSAASLLLLRAILCGSCVEFCGSSLQSVEGSYMSSVGRKDRQKEAGRRILTDGTNLQNWAAYGATSLKIASRTDLSQV